MRSTCFSLCFGAVLSACSQMQPSCTETAEGIFCNEAAEQQNPATNFLPQAVPRSQEVETTPDEEPSCSQTVEGLFCNHAAEQQTVGVQQSHGVEGALPRHPAEPSFEADDRAQERVDTEGPRLAKLRFEHGTYVAPVNINNRITLDFVIDAGASDVGVPADVVLTLIRTGTIQQTDFLEQRNYQLADGTTVPSRVFVIRTLSIAGITVHDVLANVASPSAPLLLGQSFLGRFKTWSIDNQRHLLRLN